MTFTTNPGTDQTTATYEPVNQSQEQSQYVRYSNTKLINASIFNHTAAGSYSERLNGSANEKYGLAKSISVMPGDVVTAEVYSKYVDANSANWTPAFTTLMGQISSGTAGVVIDGANYSSSTSSFPFAGLLSTAGSTGGPKAYLNWIVFDRNYAMITGGYQRLSAAPKESGNNVAHERLFSPNINITQPGYVYIYLSNEETTPVEVYFDDFKVTQTKSPVVAQDDYYPFGLTFNSYNRENSVPNKHLYNKGSERQDDLDLNVYYTHYRILDPVIGRWWQVDPKPTDAISVYASMDNNPILYNDPLGDIIEIHFRTGFLGLGKKQSVIYNNGSLTQNGQAYAGKVSGFLGRAVAGLDKIRAGGAEGTKLVGDLQTNSKTTNIMKGSNGFNESGDKSGLSNVVRWSPGNTSGGPNQNGNTNRPAFIGLGHELAHSYDKVSDNKVDYSTWYVPAGSTTPVANAEKFATHVENLLRSENNLPLRTHYGVNNSTGAAVNEGPILYQGTRQSMYFSQPPKFVPEICGYHSAPVEYK